MAPHFLEAYLDELRHIRASGAAVPETSYYPALSNLLNSAGRTVKPRVRCIMHLQNRGAGIPDGGLFTADQFSNSRDTEPRRGAPPTRGAIEAKPPRDDAFVTAETKQVSKYWDAYGAVLVTNFRDFVLIGRDPNGNPVKLESYRLAPSESAFWAAAARPKETAERIGASFNEFLKRTLLHNASLVAPSDLAFFLASYAREALYRIEEGHPPSLESIRRALEQGLGITFEAKRGDHFFHSTLVQTLFYGMFSAWVLWTKDNPPGRTSKLFDWRLSAQHLRVPILRKLFHEIAEPGQLEALLLPEVLDWACAALNRVDRASFFRTFEAGQAVQYFYEPFLENFDPELRKDLGVWYTPPEIVEYMVARVDRVLRENLKVADGLADKNVYILDPCCGTGAYLVSVIRKIAETLQAKGSDALLANDLKTAATSRVFGFELLPAPFVVAHLQLGLLLQSLGAPLTGKKERAAVYLTNALTGWEPATKPKLLFTELEEERAAADGVKQEKPILVILGNPPYNSYAGISNIEEERDLSIAYRHSNNPNLPKPQGQGLNDLYVRFFRMAERRIAEKTGKGIVCFISNYSWLDGLSHPVMRERYLKAFDHIWIDCLNGDKYRTGKLTPDGDPDPSVFSTEFNREGIQVGTAIALLTREPNSKGSRAVRFRNLWGKSKRADLLASQDHDGVTVYQQVKPEIALGFPFMPSKVGADYLSWPLLPDLFPESFPGVKTSRDDALVDIDRDALEQRMRQYFDPKVPIEQVAPSLGKDASRFSAGDTRAILLKKGFDFGRIVRYCYRPFDIRWLYWIGETKLLDEKREEYFSQVFPVNRFLVTQQMPRREWAPPQVISSIGCIDLMDRSATCFPLYLRVEASLINSGAEQPNLSATATSYLVTHDSNPNQLFFHAIATLHAPAYRAENSGALKSDWPRIPLPASAETLNRSAALGRQIAALLDPETPVPAIDQQFKRVGTLMTRDDMPIDPARDLSVTAGWGHAGQGGVTMPAKGHVEICGTEDDITYLDVFLNDNVHWTWVPQPVWEFTLGGYQVIKKWLSYRELELLGRPLTPEEARYITNVARRIAALLVLGPELDASYAACKADATTLQ